MLDVDRPLVPLTFSVLASCPVLFLTIAAMIMGSTLLDAFALGGGGGFDVSGQQPAQDLLLLGLQMIILTIADMLIAIATFQTLLTGSGRTSWGAISSISGGRAFAYFVVGTVFAIIILVGTLFFYGFAIGAGFVGPDDRSYRFALWGSLCATYLIASIFLGLVFPSIAVEGRLGLGRAIFQGFRRFGGLLLLLFLPAVPLSALDLWLAEIATKDFMVERFVFQFGDVQADVILVLAGAAILTTLTSLMVAVALSKVYARFAPLALNAPEEVPEVFR